MTDQHAATASETSPARPSVSSERGIDRLFAEMAAMYGAKFADLWAGCNIEDVKAMWVEKLKPFAAHAGVIQSAMKALEYQPNPPTLPVFLGLCRDAMRHVDTSPPSALPHKLTAEDHERARQTAEEVSRVVKPINGEGFNRHWATHPQCDRHLRFILEAATRDARFAACVTEMVRDGICTADGKLLKAYRDGAWSPVQRRAA